MIKIITFLTAFSLFHIFSVSVVQAGSCTSVGECVDGRICVKDTQSNLIYKGSESCGDGSGQRIIGEITPPKSIRNLNNLARIRDGESVGIGLIIFLSRALRLFTIGVGLFVIANVVMAAYTYISESDSSDVMTKVKEKFTYTAVGLAIIVGAYTLAAIIGLLFFGDATFILSPELTSALDLAETAATP
ncbi:MAG: hypothetical protein GW946_00690 [Candidatus Pacebacteria bacterium]|nr:hypothetical protein [Candidatus Paceibacterota bacterium]PIR60869.1 MAG: hypothetical protein COU67_00225 [Candidatus Pacebacteria bacterium CG10_big_fil_rev_8_21_14_0_10_44_54]